MKKNCEKRAFDSKEEAYLRILEIRLEKVYGLADPDKTGEINRAYLCNKCNKYHLTSMSKTKYGKVAKVINQNKEKARDNRITRDVKFFSKRKGWNLDDLL